VVIDDLDVEGITIAPDEAGSPAGGHDAQRISSLRLWTAQSRR
jgi:hypothetical protein